MRSPVFWSRFFAFLLVALVFPMSAFAYVYDENVTYYEGLNEIREYMEESNQRKLVDSDGAKNGDIKFKVYKECHEKLHKLGYCLPEFNANHYYTKDYKTAVYIFAQQMGAGDCTDGKVTSPFLQAVILTEGVAEPVIIAPVNHAKYCKDGKPYTLKELEKAELDEKVCFEGKVTEVYQLSETKERYTIVCEGKRFSVEYAHPARGTTFLKDDYVIVYGRVADGQDVQIQADMIAYSKQQ